MTWQIQAFSYPLRFRFDAQTSRGSLLAHPIHLIRVGEDGAWGEASPLAGLSRDDHPDFRKVLQASCAKLSTVDPPPSWEEVKALLPQLVSSDWPSIRFGLETALLDYLHGSRQILWHTPFSEGKQSILTNGLIWMGDQEVMYQRIEEKLSQGFTCLKMKIGGIDFEQELALLKGIRERFSASQITLRVDANGSFPVSEALPRLEKLAKLDIHSIEQPIAVKQIPEMAQLCRDSPLDIALDEELIHPSHEEEKIELLEKVKPQYLILKPTLLGGVMACSQWISWAEERGISWWITSALESNVGLNAIAQFTSTYQPTLPQGLGTGGLYHNNFPSPLNLKGEYLNYDPKKVLEIEPGPHMLYP